MQIVCHTKAGLCKCNQSEQLLRIFVALQQHFTACRVNMSVAVTQGLVVKTVCMQEPLLKYRLPAVACPPPLVLQVTPVLPSESATSKQSLLFVVQYCVNPRLAAPLRELALTLQVPKPVGQPGKVTFTFDTLATCQPWITNKRLT